MLTCVREGGKVKCDQYFPTQIEEKFTLEPSFQITLISAESVMPNLIKRKLKIQSLQVFHSKNYILVINRETKKKEL